MPRVRRRWIVVAAALLAIVVAYRLLDVPTYIWQYRVIEEHTLLLETIDGPGAWVRVTDVDETPTQVAVTVRSVHIQLGPSTAEGYVYESLATLQDPLGDRMVIDASDGHAVDRATCPPYNLPCP